MKTEISLSMADDDEDQDIYSAEGRAEEVEDDEIEPWEEGFMEGAEAGGQGAKCRNCGKVLGVSFVEEEISNKIHRFCSNTCAKEFVKKKTGEEE